LALPMPITREARALYAALEGVSEPIPGDPLAVGNSD
jgi:hypothetical protein